ncbi:hypothetical protein LXM94_10950 [Rhizobium sp. TRM95111]|nr:hypothetical protein [Rhizobium alarense]MCF3640480.1 hypothetical protein [Rhizobium alarense]
MGTGKGCFEAPGAAVGHLAVNDHQPVRVFAVSGAAGLDFVFTFRNGVA